MRVRVQEGLEDEGVWYREPVQARCDEDVVVRGVIDTWLGAGGTVGNAGNAQPRRFGGFSRQCEGAGCNWRTCAVRQVHASPTVT